MSESKKKEKKATYEFVVVWETWVEGQSKLEYHTRKGQLIQTKTCNIIKLFNPPISFETWNKLNSGSVTAIHGSSETVQQVDFHRK